MLDAHTLPEYNPTREVYHSEPRRDRYGKIRTHDSPGQPRGSEMKIAQWLDENESGGKDRAWLAEQMGVHPGTVDAWCNGSRKPKLARILKIQELTSGAVTPADWLTLAR